MFCFMGFLCLSLFFVGLSKKIEISFLLLLLVCNLRFSGVSEILYTSLCAMKNVILIHIYIYIYIYIYIHKREMIKNFTHIYISFIRLRP
jgi:hypothetical protein